MTKIVLPPEPFKLARGSHRGPFKGEGCWEEMGTLAAGEEWGNHFQCCSPIVRRLGISLNDKLNDERRQVLRPFVLRAIGTANDGREEERRQMCNEWLLHYALPTLLDKAGKTEVAARLRALPGDLAVENVRKAIYEARDEAWDARKTAVEKLRVQILAELKKRKVAAAVAGAEAEAEAEAGAEAEAVAVAEAGAEAEAVAVAEAEAEAVAEAVAEAEAEAEVVAVVVAGVVAGAVAGAVVVAEAEAGAEAVAEAEAGASYWAVRKAVREKVEEVFKPTADELLEGAIDLLDRMLPAEPLQPPVIDNAEIIFGAAA